MKAFHFLSAAKFLEFLIGAKSPELKPVESGTFGLTIGNFKV
jgi:hypothetical protein